MPAVTPPRRNIASNTSTMMTMPSISNPTWVIQLKKATPRLAFCPNGARLTMKAVVPVVGPCRLAKPSRM